jgi:hypothetical protein
VSSADGIKIMRLDGSPEMSPAVFQAAPGANLTYGDGFYVIATQKHLQIFETTKMRDPDREVP